MHALFRSFMYSPFSSVGYFNYRYFVNFLIYIFVGMLYGASLLLESFLLGKSTDYRKQVALQKAAIRQGITAERLRPICRCGKKEWSFLWHSCCALPSALRSWCWVAFTFIWRWRRRRQLSSMATSHSANGRAPRARNGRIRIPGDRGKAIGSKFSVHSPVGCFYPCCQVGESLNFCLSLFQDILGVANKYCRPKVINDYRATAYRASWAKHRVSGIDCWRHNWILCDQFFSRDFRISHWIIERCFWGVYPSNVNGLNNWTRLEMGRQTVWCEITSSSTQEHPEGPKCCYLVLRNNLELSQNTRTVVEWLKQS